MWLGAALGAVAAVPPAWAQSSIPAEITAALPQAQSLGQSRMRFFGLGIYDARLWAAPGFRASRYGEHAFALELNYLRALEGKLIAARSLQEMRRASQPAAATAQRWLQAMEAAFPNVNAGDRITGVHAPGVGARFWRNGQLHASIADPEFSNAFFGIWLSDTTSEPGLRSALLAGATP